MRYGVNRHIRRSVVVSAVYATNTGIERRNDVWRIKKGGFTPKQVETLEYLTHLDHGDSAMIVSITPLV